jgi:hypothetical protein
MKTTRYFEEQVLRKRPYIRREWCEQALREAIKREAQPDGRVRYWIFIPELDKYLRVVTLSTNMKVLTSRHSERSEESLLYHEKQLAIRRRDASSLALLSMTTLQDYCECT